MKKILLVTSLVFALTLSIFSFTACGDDDDIGAGNSNHTHTPASAVRENVVPPSCNTDGSCDEVVYCSSCQKELSRTQKNLAKTRNHDYKNGVCTICEGLQPSEGLTFTSNGDGTCYVSSIGDCVDINIIIPEISPDGDIVTSIGKSAFESRVYLESIVIPEGVTIIDDFAFNICQSLKRIILPSTLKSIGYCSFNTCVSLESIALPEGLLSIGGYAFYNCSNLKYINIPSSLETLGEYSLEGCSSLEYTKWDSGYYLGNEDNPHLVFAKAQVSYISTCEINTTTRFIASKAFYECKNLLRVTIPDSIVSFGGGAFYNCSSLKSIEIPSSLISIGDRGFYECTSLKDVYIKDLATWCNISFTDDRANPLYYATNFYLNDSLVTELVIPGGVTEIKKGAFINFTALTSVTIPDTVTKIEDNAFHGCTSLTNIVIPDSVQSIGYMAFYNCTNLASATIGSGVSRIGYYAFKGCTNLTSVTFTDPVGWGFSGTPTGESVIPIATESLSTTDSAASYLGTIHVNYHWFKK